MTDLASLVTKQATAKAKQFTAELNRQLKVTFKTELVPALKARFLEAYDALANEEQGEYGSAIRGDDPTALLKWRSLFEQQIDKELAGISVSDGEININIGDLSSFGAGQTHENRHDVPQTVDWLIYYIEGLPGEFAFISAKQAYKKNPLRSPTSLGRFGEGFIIPRELYEEEGWEKATGLKFSEVRHPISGQRPYNRFEKIPNNFDFSRFVQSAVQKAVSAVSDT